MKTEQPGAATGTRVRPAERRGARRLAYLVAGASMLLAACAAPDPPEGVELVEPLVPLAAAGEGRWRLVQRVATDLNGDGGVDIAAVIVDVETGQDGEPIWDHAHHWQVYVEDGASGERTHVYARFLPHGRLEAFLAWPQEDAPPTILLLEQTRFSFAVYEVHYGGAGSSVSRRLVDRALQGHIGFERPSSP